MIRLATGAVIWFWNLSLRQQLYLLVILFSAAFVARVVVYMFWG